jgi:hypothetical protein
MARAALTTLARASENVSESVGNGRENPCANLDGLSENDTESDTAV